MTLLPSLAGDGAIETTLTVALPVNVGCDVMWLLTRRMFPKFYLGRIGRGLLRRIWHVHTVRNSTQEGSPSGKLHDVPA
jgi:hypothetical protein